jgi:hypothetical protein
MSVLKLRRDMVVVEDETDPPTGYATAFRPGGPDRPFPLRARHGAQQGAQAGSLSAPAAEAPVTGSQTGEGEAWEGEAARLAGPAPRRGLWSRLKLWLRAGALLAALCAYPVAVVAASDVGDGQIAGLSDRSQWAAPWIGGAAMLMQTHFGELGWAPDAQPWEPMARLTAKPAYQRAMADSLGELTRLVSLQAAAAGRPDPDLEAAARLIGREATGVQLRAGRDALVNYDRRLRRRDISPPAAPEHLGAQLALLSGWAERSETAILASRADIGANPMDENATRAVYDAKGRARVAFLLLDATDHGLPPEAMAARADALKAWKAVASFHPLLVLNGDPDGSVFGNHPAAMGFLLAQAESATARLLASLPGPSTAPLNAEGAVQGP